MPKPEYSNYFTVVIYAEFNRLEKLLELGQIYQSPIHFSRNNHYVREPPKPTDIISATNEWILYGSKENKPHQHIMIKTANKYTENTFLVALMKILKNDITGIAIHESQVLVKSPTTLLRYFYHIDNPTKEHFNLATAFESVQPMFTKEVVSAFEVEIRHLILSEIMNGNIKNLQDVLTYNSYSLVFEEYLSRGRNLYLVMSLFKETREVKENKKYETVSTVNRETLKLFSNQVG